MLRAINKATYRFQDSGQVLLHLSSEYFRVINCQLQVLYLLLVLSKQTEDIQSAELSTNTQ